MKMYEGESLEPVSKQHIEDAVNRDGEWNGTSAEWRYGAINDLKIRKNENSLFNCVAHCPEIICIEAKNLATFDAAFKNLIKINHIIIDLYYAKESE